MARLLLLLKTCLIETAGDLSAMRYTDTEKHKPKTTISQLVRKAMLSAAIAICLILGVIGLILPVIPGILFLFLGAMLLSKLSARFANYLKKYSWAQKWQSRGDSFSQMSNIQRLKLSGLMAAKSLVDSMESAWQRLRMSSAE